MRPFFDASEFPHLPLAKESHHHHALQYSCTLVSSLHSATQATAYDGASENHLQEHGPKEDKVMVERKSNTSVPGKCEESRVRNIYSRGT
jgi:hypothetical protein